MKTQLRYLLLTAAAAATAFLIPASAPAQATVDDPALVRIVAEVVAQQATLIENQTKMDTQIAAIAEDVRQSRLFAARGGKR